MGVPSRCHAPLLLHRSPHGGSGPSNRLGYFPDKSIEKAADKSLPGLRRFGEFYHQSAPPHYLRGGGVPAKPKFTRIPKMRDLVEAGVQAEAIPTYCALTDYANNKTGLCWPKMETLAKTLGRSVRTIQRHLHLLKELGLIEFVERRRQRGRFSSYLYKVVHIARTTGHGRRAVGGSPNIRRTKRSVTPPNSPPTEGYSWLFGKGRDLKAEAEYQKLKEQERERASEKRQEGYEWLFK
jgi:DNA-binding transcriptional ArsR family regulator